jgi:hypothetical protein
MRTTDGDQQTQGSDFRKDEQEAIAVYEVPT